MAYACTVPLLMGGVHGFPCRGNSGFCSIVGWLLLGCIVAIDHDASQFVILVCRGGIIIRGGNDGYGS